jgi:UDP-N-acetylglucosamine 2-epimerase (non-hydrolysing)
MGIVLGTRPEIIKMSPIIRECIRTSTDFYILHTGQHYSYTMDRIFFEQLDLPEPDFHLDVGSATHAIQTGGIMAGVEQVLTRQKTDVLLVQGDTNTVLAGTLAAAKLHVPVGHVEAGLRSFDRSMPEEINRVVADHISDCLFAPTEQARQHLLNEGIDGSKVRVTGNTVVDAVIQNREIARRKVAASGASGLPREGYLLATTHRQENVDSRERLHGIITGLHLISKDIGLPVVLPVHPRTEKMIREYGIALNGIRLLPPTGYLEFLELERGASLVITDSGGVQEEACILGVPCVTLRENTERPETLQVKSNILAGTDPGRILDAARTMLSGGREWANPFGDGRAGERIVEICREISG